jgi:CBS-domain-containing membrane protein
MKIGLRSAGLSVAFLAVLGLVGVALKQPWLFPSLGPTLMVLAETPEQPAARPQSVLVGHLVGVLAGWVALLATGLQAHPSAVQEGLHARRVVAVCIAIGLTALLLQLLRAPHPPAGATTLIVSLGILHTGVQLWTMVLAILALSLLAVALQGVRLRSAPVGSAP